MLFHNTVYSGYNEPRYNESGYNEYLVITNESLRTCNTNSVRL